jgi:hypothetical protein
LRICEGASNVCRCRFTCPLISLSHGWLPFSLAQTTQSAEKKAQKKYAIEIELRNETFILVANNDKDRDTWISKVSLAIQEYNSIYVPPPPPPAGNNNGNQQGTNASAAGLAQKRNHSSGSVGSRSNSSSNVTSENGEQATVASSVPDEDGEEGLLTFDDVPNMS